MHLRRHDARRFNARRRPPARWRGDEMHQRGNAADQERREDKRDCDQNRRMHALEIARAPADAEEGPKHCPQHAQQPHAYSLLRL
jgi:hypothetical protein